MDKTPPFDKIGTNPAPDYQNADPPNGISGSIPNAAFFNALQAEALAIQDAAGITRDSTNLTQILRAIRSGVLAYAVDTGATNAPSIAPSPAHTSLVDGLTFVVKMAHPPTGPAVLHVNTLSAPIVRRNSLAMVGNEWAAGDRVRLVYAADQGAFQISGLTPSDLGFGDSSIWHIGSAGGTANTITTTLSPAPASGATNYFSAIQHSTTNTGAATLNGAPIVIDKTGAALVGGEIPTINRAEYFLDAGGNQRLRNPAISGFPNLVTISGSSNYTPPAGVRRIAVLATAPGGPGGSGTGSMCGGGGGAGESQFKIFDVASLTFPVSCTIGAPSSPSASSASQGSSASLGTQTSFGSYLVANPGVGGLNNVSWGSGGLGGHGGTGGLSFPGGPGEGVTSDAPNGTLGSRGGSGGRSLRSGGGLGVDGDTPGGGSAVTNGGNAPGPGGGGGGGDASNAGGSFAGGTGGAGEILIVEMA